MTDLRKTLAYALGEGDGMARFEPDYIAAEKVLATLLGVLLTEGGEAVWARMESEHRRLVAEWQDIAS